MFKYREVEKIFKNDNHHWVGDAFRVSQYLPYGVEFIERFSPFLLLDYNFPNVMKPISGQYWSLPHPHRGFETVTINFSGEIEHFDNQGNHGIIILVMYNEWLLEKVYFTKSV